MRAKQPLKDAAAINSTRWELFDILKKTGLSVTVGTGGRTKWNRTRFGIAKAHWLDAACVGHMGSINVVIDKPLLVTCRGQGGRQKAVTPRASGSFGLSGHGKPFNRQMSRLEKVHRMDAYRYIQNSEDNPCQ